MMKKIAVVIETNDQISSHFGMASLYQVFTTQDGAILSVEERAKPHHQHHPDHSHSHDQRSGETHADMFAPIGDCKVLIVGGMGQPAYEKARAVGLEVVLVGGEARSQVEAYLRGETPSDPRRVHYKS